MLSVNFWEWRCIRNAYLDALGILRTVSLVCKTAHAGVGMLWREIYQQITYVERASSFSSWSRLSPLVGMTPRMLPARWYFLAVCNLYANEALGKRHAVRKHKYIARLDVSRPRSRVWLSLKRRETMRHKEMRLLAASVKQ